MNQRIKLGALALLASLSACTATGEAGRPGVVVAALGKVVEALAAETMQREASETFRALPVVVRSGSNNGPETVIAEMLRTRLVEQGIPLEVACPAKCFEITLVEFVSEAGNQAAPGKVLPINAGSVPGVIVLPRQPPDLPALAPGHADVLLVTFALRDGNRYGMRQQVLAVVAVAKAER